MAAVDKNLTNCTLCTYRRKAVCNYLRPRKSWATVSLHCCSWSACLSQRRPIGLGLVAAIRRMRPPSSRHAVREKAALMQRPVPAGLVVVRRITLANLALMMVVVVAAVTAPVADLPVTHPPRLRNCATQISLPCFSLLPCSVRRFTSPTTCPKPFTCPSGSRLS